MHCDNGSLLTKLNGEEHLLYLNPKESSPMKTLISEFVAKNGSEALDIPLMLLNIDVIHNRYALWKQLMPLVEPWYAVKCNPNPVLVSELKELGCNFDCATSLEIELVTSMGHPSDKIVYANPCKLVTHLKRAQSLGVDLTVFDNEAELVKIANTFPESRLLIRLAPIDDSKAQCPMSIKFGVPPAKVRFLLEKARSLNLNVVGVHFHVGSGCNDVSAYRVALSEARRVFDLAGECGYQFSLLDMGGGYPGCDEAGRISFGDIAEEVNCLLPVLFPETKVIAEPGRFFAHDACTLVTRVVSKAEISEHGKRKIRYHINDGLYGSFNCLLYDHAALVEPFLLDDSCQNDVKVPCSVFGPTCDGFDKISELIETLPELNVGDLILWPKMGAYTSAAATNFNGFATPQYLYYKQ